VFVCLYALHRLLDMPIHSETPKFDIPRIRKRIALWMLHFDLEEDYVSEEDLSRALSKGFF
jgi:hypothetical protein